MKYLGFVLLVLSGYVMAEEVYYCSDNTNGANGFKKKEGRYTRVNFKENKFKMKLQDDGNIVIAKLHGIDVPFFCGVPYDGKYPEDKNSKSCLDTKYSGIFFNFNADNGRYVLLEGFGYVFSTNDSVSTSIGTCTKF
jgi:hypothetical protein